MDVLDEYSKVSRLFLTSQEEEIGQGNRLVCSLTYPTPVSFALALEDSAVSSVSFPNGQATSRTDLALLHLAPGLDTPLSVQKQALSWLEAKPDSAYDTLSVDVQTRSGQIRWRGCHVVVQAPIDGVEECQKAIAAFAWTWLTVCDVEQKVDQLWEDQRHLASFIASCTLTPRQQRDIADITADAFRCRQILSGVMFAVERGDKALAKTSRVLLQELYQLTGIPKRMTVMNDVLDKAEPLLLTLSDRLFEWRLAAVSMALELAILIGILVEVFILIRDAA